MRSRVVEEKDKEEMLDWEEDERILLPLPWTTVLGKGRPPATRRQPPPFLRPSLPPFWCPG